MKSAVFIAVAACCICLAVSVPFKDCGSKGGKIKALRITNCDVGPVCKLKKGTNVTVSVDFMTTEMVSKATAVVHGDIKGIEVPFPPPNPDGCKDSGLTCPLKPNASYTYHTILPIKSIYPDISLLVKWELQDQNESDVFCMFIPAQIVS